MQGLKSNKSFLYIIRLVSFSFIKFNVILEMYKLNPIMIKIYWVRNKVSVNNYKSLITIKRPKIRVEC